MKSRIFMLAGASIMAVASVTSARAQSTAAVAQTPPETKAEDSDQALNEEKDTKDIIVTGSQIRGVTPVGSTVLTTTSEQAREQGAVNGNEILANLPQASNYFNALPSFSLLANSGSSVAVARIPSQGITLRQLPGGQINANLLPTLVLMDGLRMVPTGTDVTGGQQVDPSMVSATSLLRTEVMPDGASSIYGADALGGVINYITRDGFDGVEVQVRGGTTEGSYRQFDGTIIAGTKWSTGSVFASAAYSYHDAQLGRDRSYQTIVDANPNSPLYNMPLALTCTPPNIAITTSAAGVSSRRLYPLSGIGGTILPYTTNNGTSGNGSGGAGNTNGIAGGNRCDATAISSFYPEEKRYNAMFGVKQEIVPGITFAVKANWSRRTSVTSSANNITVLKRVTDPVGYLPVCNAPVVAPAVQPAGPICGVTAGYQTGDQNQVQTISTNLDASPVGPLHSYISLETWQVTPSLAWNISDKWQLRAMGTYGHSKTDGIQGVLQTALIQTRATAGLINPYNLPASGVGAFDGVINYSDKVGVFDLFNAKVIADGPLLKLPAGELRVAAGVEYLSTKFSSLSTGSVNSNTPSNFLYFNVVDGSTRPLVYVQKDKAAFAEANVPLVSDDMDVPLINTLGLAASARYDKYNDFGGTFNYEVGVNWSPLSWVKTHGNYNTSFTAPSNITQIATITGSQANGTDCNGENGDLCGSTGITPLTYFPGYYPPGIYAAGILAGTPLPAGAQVSQVGAQNQNAPTGLNILMNQGTIPGIGPQKGKSWSVGFDIEPPIIPGLSFGASYYNLRINDQIQLINGNTFQVRPDAVHCHNGVLGTDPNAQILCAIPFAASELTTPGPLGFLAPVTAGGQSLPSSLTTTGLNSGSGTALSWQTVLANYCGPDKYPNCPAGSYSIFAVRDHRATNIATLWSSGFDFRASYRTKVPWGTLDARFSGTKSRGVKSKATPTSPITLPSEFGSSLVRWSGSVGTTWGGLRVQGSWQHTGGYKIDPVNYGTTGTATVPGTGLYGQTSVKAFDTFDLFFRYDFDGLAETSTLFKNLEITLNVTNFTDADPPRNGGGFTNGSTLGREFILGVRKRF